jgi:membrane-associated protease RseP (regulator of RpoE activity)
VTVALYVLGLLIFLAGIGLSIGLHEIGHLLPAKRFGVKVTQYMVGFGPTLWSKHTRETEYGVKAIPLGGYIRMIGMYPPARGADPSMLRASSTGRFSTLVDEARQQSLEEVRPEDADRVFYKLPVHRRIVVMLGGPVMNLLLAFVLFTIVLSVLGLPSLTTSVGRVVECVPTTSNATGAANADGTCTPSTRTPAVLGGLRVDDTIVSFGGVPVTSWEEAQGAIRGAEEGETAVVVQRGDEEITLVVPLETIAYPVLDAETGEPTGAVEQRIFLGVAPRYEMVTQPVTAVPGFVWDTSVKAMQTIITLPARMVDLMRQTFTEEERDRNGIVGPVGIGRLSGEVVAEDGLPMKEKASLLVGFLAGLNLFLFLFNLIPLLPLDGGHVAGAVWESIKRAWARFRHLPDPGPVDVAKALPVTYVVSIGLVLMGGLVLIADLIKPISLFS